jgi:hypothetical protein
MLDPPVSPVERLRDAVAQFEVEIIRTMDAIEIFTCELILSGGVPNELDDGGGGDRDGT